MEIRTETNPACATINLDGRLTMGPSATAFRSAVETAIAEKAPSIIVNMDKVVYVDSAGLGAIAAGVAQSKAAGIPFSVAAPAPRVLEALELVCLNRVLTIHNTVDDAKGSDSTNANQTVV